MFACKHVLFFVTQIYSLLFCHADLAFPSAADFQFADAADLFFFTQMPQIFPLIQVPHMTSGP